MKNITVLYAAFETDRPFEKSFDSLCAFEKALQWAYSLADSVKTVILTDSKNSARIKDFADSSKTIIVEKENWTNVLAACSIATACKANDADFAVIAWGDNPFLNKSLTEEIIKNHVEYRAEYTFADGFADGFAPVAVDTGAASIIASLAESSQKAAGEKPFSRDGLFEIMSGDINSFEIETVLADKDYRMLRFNFECTTKAGLKLCTRLFDEAKQQKTGFSSADFDVYKLSDLAESLSCMQQSLPSYYNVQISNLYNTKSLYNPYGKLFAGKNLPEMKLEDFKVLVKKICDFSAEAVVGLSLFGEPCLNAQFADFCLEVLKNPSLKLFVETDGLNFSQTDAEKIAEAAGCATRVDFAVQLGAVDDAMYEKINGIAGENYKKAVETVLMLNRIFPGHVYPQFTRMKANESQLEQFYRLWKEKQNGSDGQLLITKYDSLAGLLSNEKPADLSPLERNACWHIRRDFNILSDGSVPLCRTRADEIAGNAFTESLEEIWKKIEREVQSHIEKKYCKRCLACDEYYTFNF